MKNNFVTISFKNALIDFYYLINKNYPKKEVLKLVGDQFRLTGVQRTILFRGITSNEKVIKRKAKLSPLENLKGKELYVDGYNILFTIMNYLLGKSIFIANDGLLRDSGGTYGKIENEMIFYQAVNLLMDFLPGIHSREIAIYLDQPISNSNVHINQLEEIIRQKKIKGKIRLLPSVDQFLKQLEDGVIATSDSQIIDQTPSSILDLARHTLESTYGISIFDIGCLTRNCMKYKRGKKHV
jgi:hypothetical protein